jgi:hemoglobin-like flavoprotein
MITPEQKELVQQTFEDVKPVSGAVAQLFYSRLFQLNPSLKELFRSGLEEQRKKLLLALTAVVESLDRFDDMRPLVQAMAVRHQSYGVKPADYEVFGAALLWTLERALGPQWTPPVQRAWAAVYDLLAETMKGAAISERQESLPGRSHDDPERH